MIISEMEIRLSAGIARLQQDLDNARRAVGSTMDRISASVAGAMKMFAGLAAGLTVAALASFVKGGIDAADAMDELREKTGLLMKDVAGVRLIFQREGFGDQELVTSMSKLSKAITTGGGGLAALKVATKEASGEFRSTKDVLYDVADRFAEMENGAQKSALAMEIFGKSGVSLIPMLNGGSEGMRDMAEMAQKLGLVISQETATAAGDFNDTLSLIGQGSQGVAQGIAAELLPTLNGLAGSFLTTMTSGDKLASTAKVLGSTLKILYTVGAGIVEVFSTVGKAVGAAAAMTVAVLSGNFAEAATIHKSLAADIGEGWASSARAVSDAWTGAGAETVGAMAKVGKAQKDLLAAQEARDAAAKKDAAAYVASVKAAKDFAGALEVETAQVGLSADQIKMMAAARAAAKAPTAELRMEIMKAALALDIATKAEAEKVAADKAVAESNKRAAEGLAEFTKLQQAYGDQVAKSIQAANDEATKNEELVATFGMTKNAIEQLELARLQDQLAQRASTGLALDEIAALEALIDAKKRNVAATGNLEALEANKKANEEMVAEYKRTVDRYDDVFRTGFADMLNHGKSGWKSFTTSLLTTFKTTVADQIYKMMAQPFVVKIVGSLLGVTGGGTAQAAAGALGGGGASSTIGLLNAGKTIYEGFTTGFAGVAGTLGGYVSQMGALFGSSSISAFGAGMGLTGSQAATAAAAYNSAGMAGTGSALTSGAAAAPWVTGAAGVAGGIYGGRAISGEYGSNSTVNAGTAIGAVIGSVVPVVGTALGALVGGLLGGVANRLFGMGEKKVTSTMIDGTLTATGATGNNVSAWTQKGGLFRSNKSGTDTSALTGEQTAAFSTAYKGILDVSKTLGTVIGADTSALSTRVQKLSIDFKGLTTDAEKAGAITKFFEGVADTIALEMVPNLKSFQKEGESISVTMQRIVTNYASLDGILASMGTTFGATGVSSITAREGLIAAAGGLDKLASGASYFQQNFLTEAEQLAPVQKQLTEAMASLGLSSITTVDQFKQYALGIDKTTTEGAKLFAKMLELAPAFKQITDASDALARSAKDAASAAIQAAQEQAAALAQTNAGFQNQIDTILAARKGEAAVRALEIAGMDASTVALYDRLAALKAEDAATKSLLDNVNKAYAAVQASVEAQKTALNNAYQLASDGMQASIDRVSGSVSKLQSLSESLQSTLDSMTFPGQEKQQRQEAQARIAAALAIAKAGGPLPDVDALKGALSTVAKDASSQFSSYTDYQRDLYRTRNNVAGLSGYTDMQLSVEQLTLKSLQDQKKALDDAHKQDLARLDATLEYAKQQTGLLSGMAASLMMLPDALAALASALGAAQKDPTIGTDALTGLYKELLGRAPDAGGLKFWQDALASGVSLDSIRADFIKGWEYQSLHPPGFAAGGDHIGGLRVVGEDGPELEATGPSRIFNANQTKSMLGGGNAELVAEVRALRTELSELKASSARTAASSEEGTGLLKRVIRNDKLYIKET